MPTVVRCHQGHVWEISSGADDQQLTLMQCPICGASPLGAVDAAAPAVAQVPTLPPRPAADSAPAPREVIHTSLPGYEILGVLGRGGHGIVYKARHERLKRLVAVKMLRTSLADMPGMLARFRAEAEMIAQLQHPNIVQIHEIGEHEGWPFLALEYVEGASLASKLQRQAFTPRRAAQLVETLARAVQAAHERGVLHRDLKPGNVLLTRQDVPKLTDFGLGKRIGQAAPTGAGMTNTGDVLGTPSYMAPEQAAGRSRDVGPASDVYALGAILYELLTQRPPFLGDTPLETMMQVLYDEPIPPRRLQPLVPGDLQTICLKCLRKEPAERYASAALLAEELRAYLHGEPIQADTPSRWQQLLRRARNQPLAAALVGIGLLAALGLLVGLWWYDTMALASMAVLSLLLTGWWYSARLQRALRHAQEQSLLAERQLERFELLLEATQGLMAARSLQDVLQLLSETTAHLANAERATIYLLDAARRELVSQVALGAEVREIRVPLGVGVAGTVAETGETIVLDDPYRDSRFNTEVDRRTGYQTRNMLTLAMRDGRGEIVGVFQVLNKRQGVFGTEDLAMLHRLAASAALAVERARGAAGG